MIQKPQPFGYPPALPQAAPKNAFASAQPRFGNAALAKAGTGIVESGVPKIGKIVKAFDFDELGASTVTQIKLIYAMCILSRLVAAAQRSYNEVRETAVRDSMGYTFWFFATPMIQRAFLLATPKKYRDALIQKVAKPEAGHGLRGTLKRLNWQINPLARWQITSSQQVKDWMHQGLNALERAGHGRESEAFIKMQGYFKNLSKFRNLATGVGMATAIALLGVVIPLWNIYVTKKNVAAGKVGLGGGH